MKLKHHRVGFCEQMAKEIEAYRKTCFSGVEPDSEETIALSETAKDLIEKIERVEGLSRKLDSMAEKNKNYRHLLTIPGVGPKIASTIFSEIGDLSSFPSGGQTCQLCWNSSSNKTIRNLVRITFANIQKRQSQGKSDVIPCCKMCPLLQGRQ